MKLLHGQYIRCSAEFWRRTEWQGSAGYYERWWQRADKPPRMAVFLGYRTLSNGWVQGHEDRHLLVKSRIKVALVSFNATTSPKYVPLDSIEEIND